MQDGTTYIAGRPVSLCLALRGFSLYFADSTAGDHVSGRAAQFTDCLRMRRPVLITGVTQFAVP
ncbi:hypothetical protein D3C81_1930340 [compost metagenome]